VRERKTLVLADSGEHANYELAHAVDDILEPDNSKNLARTGRRLREEWQKDAENLLGGLEPFLTAYDSQYFQSAGSPEFLKAYQEYIRAVRAGRIKMSWAQDDISRLIETYMWAFGWALSEQHRDELARQAPALSRWVNDSLERLAALAGSPTLEAYCSQGER
jgi:hypothetical protein